ncbi:glucose-6-phosphate dehydrogenase [Candidatus Peregrinibacteria bacterium CG10_big_fil_rev_8_21_14_0_10_36_19]|nr:MAG: glucose-6-phosphate dehydrogenase [Candidatus Peregrinibacteria bacterium CG10_big_fil_rev_8_21_14_0_10_36_19]
MKLFQIKNSFVLTIFGASGDLAKLKLFPALYSLAEQKRFPKDFYIIGYSRSPLTRKEFQNDFEKSIKKAHPKADLKIIKKLTDALYYFQGQYNHKPDFEKLRDFIKEISGKNSLTNMAYFSVPPQVFKDIIQNLGETKRSKTEDLRLIIEKPFGEDTQSAKELFHFVARYFEEENVYLLDHYLGKTGVQSILSLRHSNRILNTMMKGPEVSNIQITASESIGVTSRVGYFDQVGTLKDMVQSHLFQILALIAMSIPITDKSESLKREKYNILSALKFNESNKNITLGQYESYKNEKEVPKNSKTETFAALRLFIDRESWYKTPIYVRTGKKLAEKKTCVVIELKKFAFQSKDEEPNRLIFELQPEERINIQLVNKNGLSSEYKSITTSESIACNGDDCLPEHSNLLLDVMRKNRLHFLSFQEIIASWEITDSIIKFAKKSKTKIELYKDGSEGPKSQHKLTEMDGFKWFDLK